MSYTVTENYLNTSPGNPVVPNTLNDPLAGTVAPLPSFNDSNPNNDALNNAITSNDPTNVNPNTPDTSNVSPTTFTTGPDDKLKVVDAYAVTTSGSNNSLQNPTKSSVNLYGILSTALTAVNVIARSTSPLGKSGLSTAALNQRNIITLIGATFPGALKSAFGQMSPAMVNSMNVNQQQNGNQVYINNNYQTINNQHKPADAGDINAIINTLAYLTSPSNANLSNLNNANLINISVGLVNTSVQYGLSGVFTAICGGDVLSGNLLGAVATELLAPIIDGSLIGLMSEILNANQGTLIPLVTSSFPAFIQRFVIGYKAPTGYTNTQLVAQWNLMVECFNKIDPEWLLYNRNGQEIVNAELITWFSSDLIKIMYLAYGAMSPIIPNINTLDNTSPYSIPDNNYRVLFLAIGIMHSTALISIQNTFPNVYIDPTIQRQYI